MESGNNVVAQGHLAIALNSQGAEIWRDVYFMRAPFLRLQLLYTALNIYLGRTADLTYNLNRSELRDFLETCQDLAPMSAVINSRYNRFCKAINDDKRCKALLNLYIGYSVKPICNDNSLTNQGG